MNAPQFNQNQHGYYNYTNEWDRDKKERTKYKHRTEITEEWHKSLGAMNPTPHESKEQFYSKVSKRVKADPATVEAELQREEDLWNS